MILEYFFTRLACNFVEKKEIMGDCLFELEQVIRSSNQGKLRVDEAHLLSEYKVKAVNEFTLGAGVGAGIAWLASRKLFNVLRFGVTGGTAAFIGLWRLRGSLDSSAQHILGMEGSRMQVELARIMLRRRPNDQITKQIISRHFYSEKVFDDLNSQFKSVWRQRNFFVDNPADPVKRHETDYGHDDADSEPKQITMESGFAAMENPLDCVFGVPPPVEEMQRSVPSPLPRKNRRRRSHRNHSVHE